MELKMGGDIASDDYIPTESLIKDPNYLKRTKSGIVLPNSTIDFIERDLSLTVEKPEPLPWDQRTDLIMLGTGPTWKQCPFDAEVWSVNDAFQSLAPKRLDKLFFFDKDYMMFPFPCDPKSAEKTMYLKARGIEPNAEIAKKYDLRYRVITPDILNALDIPICTFWIVSPIKKLEMFPLWEIIAHFKSDFFTNSFGYMTAYALWLGKYKKLRYYGVDMSNQHEIYRNERGCVEHWIGVARGMGLDIEISKGSHICKRDLYCLDA